MTFQLVTRYCKKCQTGTPFEYDDETERGRCAICADKQTRHRAQKRTTDDHQTETERFIAALDGHGNRGERKKER
jgi:hypothetical protein